MNGLTDGQQAVLVLVSASMIAVAAASIPAGSPWYVSLVLGLVGAVGLTIKEKLGIAKPAATTGAGATAPAKVTTTTTAVPLDITVTG